jgi:hypothetical protein
MSKSKNDVGSAILGFFLLVAVVWVAFAIARAFFGLIKPLPPNVAAAIVAAAGTLVGSIFTLLYTKSSERKNIVRQQIREKKIPIYEELISTSFKVLYAERLDGQALPEDEVTRLLVGVTERLIIWGSDEVLLAYKAFRQHSVDSGSAVGILFVYEQLLLAIRKDLGHSNEGIGKGSLLALWINDIDQVTRLVELGRGTRGT